MFTIILKYPNIAPEVGIKPTFDSLLQALRLHACKITFYLFLQSKNICICKLNVNTFKEGLCFLSIK